MAQGKTTDGRVEAERRQGPSDARVIELVDARRQASIRYNHGVFNRLQNYYSTYRGLWQGKIAQFRNNVTIPFTLAMIQSDVARKVQTIFSAWPLVSFEGYSYDDQDRAKRNEILISAQMKDCDSVIRAVDFFLQANICGTGICRFGWKNLVGRNRTRSLEQIAPGFEIPVVREYDAEFFHGPIWEVVDRLDFYQQPGKTRIDEMAWVVHRYWADLDDLLEDARQPDSYWDRGAVESLEMFPMSGAAQGEFVQRRGAFRSEFDYQARQSERFSRPVEIWEMEGLVPDEFATDGIRHRCIAIGNGRVVLKNREAPLGRVKRFLSYAPMPDPYSFDGIGKAEVAYGPQRTADRITNQKLDALDLLIDPMYVASSTANLNTQNLFTRAGRIILVDGAADDSNIRALSPNMNGLQAAYAEVNQLWQFMQLGAGINDIVMGLQPGNRETARGFLGRQENVLTRLSLEGRLAEEGFIEPLANNFRRMDRMWLSLPREIKILGRGGEINSLTGLPYAPEAVTVDYDDLVPDYRARALGASQMAGRSARQQNLLGLLQMMSSNPALAQLVNWANFARQAFELFDFKNVDELLVQQVPMVNQIAQETGQSPEGIAQMASSQNLPQLDPALLAILGGQNPGQMQLAQ